MIIKVTEQGVTIPKEFFIGVEAVEVHQEGGRLVMIPTQPKRKRIAGLHPNSMRMSENFDEPLPDEFWLGTDE